MTTLREKVSTIQDIKYDACIAHARCNPSLPSSSNNLLHCPRQVDWLVKLQRIFPHWMNQSFDDNIVLTMFPMMFEDSDDSKIMMLLLKKKIIISQVITKIQKMIEPCWLYCLRHNFILWFLCFNKTDL